ncbi:MAG: sarcosine oxidase subunit gamma family protein [Pseudomonadota bacterium]
MVEPVTLLAQKQVPGTYGAQGLSAVVMGTRPVRGLSQIAGWDSFDKAAAPVLKSLGFAGLGDYRKAQVRGDVTTWRAAPGKILIEGAGDLSKYTSDALAVLDLGHARAVITLEGSCARDVLSTVVALDMRERTFPAGCYVQTVVHHVGVMIHCTGDDSFDIFVPASWAETIWDFVFCNAVSFGVIVKGPPDS